MEKLAVLLKDDSLTDIEKSVLSGVEMLAKISALKLGVSFSAYSKNSLSKFLGMPKERKQTILGQTAVLEKIISGASVEIANIHEHDEWPLIKRAMRLYGLHTKDDFQTILQKDDVIEVYSEEHIQLFRTFNFYKYSAYSYLDLLVNEWFHLWERPRHLLESLMSIGQSVVNGDKKGITSMVHLPQHVYKEIYNSEDAKNFEARSVLCKFGHICPIHKADESIGGFIINCRVQVLGYGEDTKSLSFI